VTICEDAYDAGIMCLAVDFLKLVKDAEQVKATVWGDLERQIKQIEDGGGLK
jgi:hypothetical protein